MTKYALLVGVSKYEEPTLKPLPGATKDVQEIKKILQNPDIGEFLKANIKLLEDPDRQEVEDAIYDLFNKAKKEDLILFYFSGHGVTDEHGQLYFATRRTRKDGSKLRDVSAVSAKLLQEKMSGSRSEQQVVILDCCFSGAFSKGMLARSDGSVNIGTQLGGKGRAVLTSSTSTQYSFEHKDPPHLGIYTTYLLKGIKGGLADENKDGYISVEELHEYVCKEVKEYCLNNNIDPMTPEIYAIKEGYKIPIAKVLPTHRLKPRRNLKGVTPRGRKTIDIPLQLGLGNPSSAEKDYDNFLIQRPQYALSYNATTCRPNWVSWHLRREDLQLETALRTDLHPDSDLPSDIYRVKSSDYTNSGYERRRLCPRGDRMGSYEDQYSVCVTTNIVPQAAQNREIWIAFESFCRELALVEGNQLFLISGPGGSMGTIANRISIPQYLWKIAVILPEEITLDLANEKNTRVIAIQMSNSKRARIGDWRDSQVTVRSLEDDLGYEFFSELPPQLREALKEKD